MNSENGAVVAFELTLDDYRAFQSYACRPVRRPPLRYLVVLWLACFAGVFTALSFLPSPESFFFGLFGALVLFVGYSIVLSRRARAITDPQPNGSILCRWEYSFDDEGLRNRTPHWEGVTRWSGILRVEETDQHLFVMIDRAAAYTIPKRVFASPADASSFAERIRARLAAPHPAVEVGVR